MLKLNDQGKAVQTTDSPADAETVVRRMYALIGILQNPGDTNDVSYEDHLYYTLEMLKEQLPTIEQAKLYLEHHPVS